LDVEISRELRTPVLPSVVMTMTTEPLFEIFSGLPEENAMWLEAVAGLADARSRMEHIAAETPGAYFIFSALGHAIVAKIDTSAKAKAKSGAA